MILTKLWRSVCCLFWTNPTYSTPSCCCKYSLEHQMFITLQLKIVPKKCTIYSNFSNVCWKLQPPFFSWKSLFGKCNYIFVSDLVLKMYVFSTNKWDWGAECHRPVGKSESIERLTNPTVGFCAFILGFIDNDLYRISPVLSFNSNE